MWDVDDEPLRFVQGQLDNRRPLSRGVWQVWVLGIAVFFAGMLFGAMIVEHRRTLQATPARQPYVLNGWTIDETTTTATPQRVVTQPLILADEWVTHPNGAPVCRVRRDIFREDGPPTAWLRANCEEWHEEKPPFASPVMPGKWDWLDVTASGRQRVHVADRWVP